MLEITANQMVRLMLFAVILITLLAVIALGFASLYLKQQMQAASDLLSSTGGYMKTEQQQRQWWKLTHDPMIRVVSAEYTGVTENDVKNGITTTKINRGMPTYRNNPDVRTRYKAYSLPDDHGTGSFDGWIGGNNATFESIEAKARQTAGGIALNGPTGVNVNLKMLNNPHIGDKQGYMMVPAHYGNPIKFTIQSRIPLLFFNTHNQGHSIHYTGKDGKRHSMVETHQQFLSNYFTLETASLRGTDALYVNKNQQEDTDESDAETRAQTLLQAAADQSGVGVNTFGFGQLGVSLDSTSSSYYQGLAQPVYEKWINKLRQDQTTQQVVADTKAGLIELNNLFKQNGGKFTDPDNHEEHTFSTTQDGLAPSLVFKGKNGQQFTPQTLPNDFHQWPSEINPDED